MENETKQTEQKELNWLEEESKNLEKQQEISSKPALKLEDGKVTTFEVDFEKKFEEWVDPTSEVVKKILPVKHNGAEMVFWLSTKNPLYRDIIRARRTGQKVFKVMRSGKAAATRYTLVKE